MADTKARERNSALIVDALEALEDGRTDAARRKVEDALEDGRLAVLDAAVLIQILERLGDVARAGKLRAATLDGIRLGLEKFPDTHAIHLDSAIALLELDEGDRAEEVLVKAIALNPDDLRAGFPLIHRYLKRGAVDALRQVWQPYMDCTDDAQFRVGIKALVKGFGLFGHVDHALRLIEEARPRWGRPAELDKMARDLQGLTEDSISVADAVSLFDAFAESYDKNLTAIGNRGPQMIAAMIERLGWVAEGKRAILDAGCGTGLCAPYLRPHARLLHGCDISVNMLEKSKSRNVYDLLTRTDLNNPVTYPEGVFDAAVVADVFVYFGDLVPAMTGIASRLKPGGWIILTVEDGEGVAPARGWQSYGSGRFRHTGAYVAEALVRSGFSRPRAELQDMLRKEFGEPIAGLCVAAQKLALGPA